MFITRVLPWIIVGLGGLLVSACEKTAEEPLTPDVISIDLASARLTLGQAVTISASAGGTTIAPDAVTWTSNDEAVVRLMVTETPATNGTLATAPSTVTLVTRDLGTTTITVTSKDDPTVSASATVHVEPLVIGGVNNLREGVEPESLTLLMALPPALGIDPIGDASGLVPADPLGLTYAFDLEVDIGIDGSFSLPLPAVRDVPPGLLVPAERVFLIDPRFEGCGFDVTNDTASTSLVSYQDLLLLPTLGARNRSDAIALGLVLEEEFDTIEDVYTALVEGRAGLGFWILADEPVRITTPTDGCATFDDEDMDMRFIPDVELDLVRGWNPVVMTFEAPETEGTFEVTARLRDAPDDRTVYLTLLLFEIDAEP